MGFTLIARGEKGANGGNSVTTDAADLTGAGLIALSLHRHQASADNNISDSEGNTWQSTPAYDRSDAKVRIYYCINPTVSATQTFSASAVTGSIPSLIFMAFSVTATPNYNGQESGNTLAKIISSIQPVSAVTPVDADNLIIAAVTSATFGSTNPTIDEGFTKFTDTSLGFNSAITTGAAMAYLTQSSATPRQPTYSNLGVDTGAAMAIAVFGIAASGNPWYYRAQQRVKTAFGRRWERRGLLWTPDYAAAAA